MNSVGRFKFASLELNWSMLGAVLIKLEVKFKIYTWTKGKNVRVLGGVYILCHSSWASQLNGDFVGFVFINTYTAN